MPVRLFELGAESERSSERSRGSSIVTGTVVNNCDLIMQGKVLVRIPSLDQEVWARLTAIGAGSDRGFFFVPQPDDEVLVALNQDEPTDAFIIGGLWNNQDRTPASIPTDGQTRRTLRTGIAGGVGHEMDFDDAQQSLTITSSTRQSITLDPTKIELTNLAGSVKITLDNTTQTISIKAAKSIELEAVGNISLKAAKVDIEGKVSTSLVSQGACSIQGKMVKIN